MTPSADYFSAAASLQTQRKQAPLHASLIRIGSKTQTRLEFGVLGTSSTDVFYQHVDLAMAGERIDITAVAK